MGEPTTSSIIGWMGVGFASTLPSMLGSISAGGIECINDRLKLLHLTHNARQFTAGPTLKYLPP